MKLMTHPEVLFLGLPGNRARELASEIASLRAALACVTAEASPQQIHGRVDSLLHERVTELNALLAALADAGPTESSTHG